jgi:hypothetical protein
LHPVGAHYTNMNILLFKMKYLLGKKKAKQDGVYLRNITFFGCCEHTVLVHRRVRVKILLLFRLHAATNLVCDVKVSQP